MNEPMTSEEAVQILSERTAISIRQAVDIMGLFAPLFRQERAAGFREGWFAVSVEMDDGERAINPVDGSVLTVD